MLLSRHYTCTEDLWFLRGLNDIYFYRVGVHNLRICEEERTTLIDRLLAGAQPFGLRYSLVRITHMFTILLGFDWLGSIQLVLIWIQSILLGHCQGVCFVCEHLAGGFLLYRGLLFGKWNDVCAVRRGLRVWVHGISIISEQNGFTISTTLYLICFNLNKLV